MRLRKFLNTAYARVQVLSRDDTWKLLRPTRLTRDIADMVRDSEEDRSAGRISYTHSDSIHVRRRDDDSRTRPRKIGTFAE